METKIPRPFEEVSLLVTGVQLGQSRFRESIYEDNLPRLASWRCNLTALSSSQNLYFVAYNEKIYVFEPQFPTQALPSFPALIIDTLPSSPDLPAYIDHLTPHSINNLVVQLLGNSEILTVVRDDGDVDAYLTRHIHQAIDRRRQNGNTLGWQASDVKPFFHRNVGNSAWGLAIHSEARMIAVSSNNLEITVFTFALTEGESGDEDEDMTDEQTYYSGSGISPPTDRRKNDTRVIRNGTANIPSIAFCNTGHDKSGKWLVSTDITGLVRGWNVHTLEPGGAVFPTAHSTRLFRYDSDLFLSNFDRLNAGWSVMFLNPKAFRHTKTLAEALGLPPYSDSIMTREPVWDASSGVGQVRRNAGRFSHPPAVHVADGNYSNPLDGRGADAAFAGDRRAPATTTQPSNTVLPTQRGEDSRHVTRQQDSSSEAESESEEEGLPYEFIEDVSHPDSLDDDFEEQEDDIANEDDDDEDEDEDEDDPSDTSPAQVRFQGSNSLCASLPCPILQASVSSLYLFQPSPSTLANGHAPIITIRSPFAQDLPLQHHALQRFERCNMHAQIPALGVVVLATQKGRVAILSLTQIVVEALDETLARVRPKKVFGYRVDHILPLAGQEAAGHRPPVPLHGIAVGPMQGTETAPEELRRWRLLVMYQDHSVLGYEIKRAEGDRIEVCGGGGDVMI